VLPRPGGDLPLSAFQLKELESRRVSAQKKGTGERGRLGLDCSFEKGIGQVGGKGMDDLARGGYL